MRVDDRGRCGLDRRGRLIDDRRRCGLDDGRRCGLDRRGRLIDDRRRCGLDDGGRCGLDRWGRRRLIQNQHRWGSTAPAPDRPAGRRRIRRRRWGLIERRSRVIDRGRRCLVDRRRSLRPEWALDRPRAMGAQEASDRRAQPRRHRSRAPVRRRRRRGRRIGRRDRTAVGHRVGDGGGRRVRLGGGGLRARGRRQGAREEDHQRRTSAALEQPGPPGLVLAANVRHRRTATQNFAVRQRPPTPQRSTYLEGDPASIGAALPKFVSRRTSLLPVHPRAIEGTCPRAGGLPASIGGAGRPRRGALSASPIEAHLLCRRFRRNRPWYRRTQRPLRKFSVTMREGDLATRGQRDRRRRGRARSSARAVKRPSAVIDTARWRSRAPVDFLRLPFVLGATIPQGGRDEVHAADPPGHHAAPGHAGVGGPVRRGEGRGLRRLPGDQRDARG